MHDTLLVQAFNAYRRGLRKQGDSASYMGPRDFDGLMFLEALGLVPLQERPRLRQLQRSCTKALQAARQGKLSEAARRYEEAQEDLDLLAAGTRLGWLLGTSSYEAGFAYLDFRRHQVESARDHLERAMDADLRSSVLAFRCCRSTASSKATTSPGWTSGRAAGSRRSSSAGF